MRAFYYSKWDGTELPFNLKKRDIMDTFKDNIMKGMFSNMSLTQMVWEGFSLAGMKFRVMGLEEMLSELSQKKERLYSKYTLEQVFEKPIGALKFLLQSEADMRQQKGMKPSPLFEDLPSGLLEKLSDLENFNFENIESSNLLAAWLRKRKDILYLFEFYSQYAKRFTGDLHLAFEEAVQLMRQFQHLDYLQHKLVSGKFSEIIPQHLRQYIGDDAEKSLNILIQLPSMITENGASKKKNWKPRVTTVGMRALGESAFGKLFQHIKKDRHSGYFKDGFQRGEMLPDKSKPYHYGDRFDLDITRTILNSISHKSLISGELNLDLESLYVCEREQFVTSTIIILLDLSWSMSLDGRFEAAKKVAIALNHYIRTRFPKDRIHMVGFSTEAHELKDDDLTQVVWDSHQPFTNLQSGLKLAMQLIKRSGNRNNRVMVITDGQPTAYYKNGQLNVELPDNTFGLSPNAVKATLAEVRRVTAQGMRIETFMLDNNPALIEFTHQIARINKGRAVLCLPGRLGNLILVEKIKRRGGNI